MRYKTRSCLSYLRPRARLFTNKPRSEGCRVKKIRMNQSSLFPVSQQTIFTYFWYWAGVL